MKKILVLFILFSSLINYSVTGQQHLQRRYETFLEEYTRMKTRGIVSLSIGGVALVSGTILTVDGIHRLNNIADDGSSEAYDKQMEASLEVIGGLICGLIGVPLTSVGIVHTILGSRKSNEYKEKLQNLSLGAVCTPRVKGLSLVYRF
ncbi:MAG: hypothetical protein JXK95_12995 [Bacteroidales bacterium]|nr:hypothetical protein [Bacteroidales bacterium]